MTFIVTVCMVAACHSTQGWSTVNSGQGAFPEQGGLPHLQPWMERPDGYMSFSVGPRTCPAHTPTSIPPQVQCLQAYPAVASDLRCPRLVHLCHSSLPWPPYELRAPLWTQLCVPHQWLLLLFSVCLSYLPQ